MERKAISPDREDRQTVHLVENNRVFLTQQNQELNGSYRERHPDVMHAFIMVNRRESEVERQMVMEQLPPQYQIMLMEDEVCELRGEIRDIDRNIAAIDISQRGLRHDLHNKRREHDMLRRSLRHKLAIMKPR